MVAKGSCLCGDIQFEVEILPDQVYSCHCSKCQRSHGAAFATQAFAIGKTLKFARGEDKLSDYFSGGGFRAFCSTCGSRLMNYAADKGDYLSVAVACIDLKAEISPIANVCIETKLGWHKLDAAIPAFEGIPEDVG